MLPLSMGDSICLPPTLNSLPLHLTPHTFTVQHVAALPPCHPTFAGQLVTTSCDVLPSCSQQVRSQSREAMGMALGWAAHSGASALQLPHGGSWTPTRAEHGLSSVFPHPHRDLAPCGAAVHDLQQSCGVGAGRGGIPSAACSTTGAAHKSLIPPFPAVFFCRVSLPTDNSLLWLSSPE